ncbi:MAG: hypothetical protein HC799_05385 [Limnothrix sp. RL_2_0]|nr:hypothetical protein [Limnothrix sp. RL_2_0]
MLTGLIASPAIAEIVSVELDQDNADKQNIIQSQGVQATLTYEERIDIEGIMSEVPVLNISGGGASIETTASYSSFPYSQAQIAEMDPANNLPEVIFSSFTGGAHCCNEVKILTFQPQTSQWEIVDVGFFDGGINGVEDFDQNGVYEFITYDNRFLYKYSSYAGSFAPVQVLKLAGLAMKDVSKEAQFLPLHRKVLQDMWQAIEVVTDEGYEVNGVLAGYMATKAILGETTSGWELVQYRYDRSSDWGLRECPTNYDDQGNCASEWVDYESFPAALRGFLLETGYLSE